MTRLPLVSPVDRVLFLKAQGYIRGLPAEILSALALYTEERFYPAGSTIRSGGSLVEQVHFLGEGRVEIVDEESDHDLRFFVDPPGIIGLGHYYAGVSRAPAVRAYSDTICLELDVADLDQILEDHFALLLQFARGSANEVLTTLRGLGARRPPEDGFEDGVARDAPSSFDLVHRLAFARRMPFLRDANLTVLGQLIRNESPRRIDVGEAIWRSGEAADSIALVLEGCFRLAQSEAGDGSVIAPTGSVLGVWEILSLDARVEGWIAETPARVLIVRRDLFTDLLEDHHEFGLAYLRYTARKTIEAWAIRDRRQK